MRNTLSTLALAGLLTLGPLGAVAMAQDMAQPAAQDQGQQGPPPGGPRRGMMNPDEQLKHMGKQLDLTADQKNQIKPILDGQQQQMQALREDQSLSRQDRMAKMKSIHEDSKAKIEAVLNDQQKQKYEAMEAERMQRMQERRGGGAPPQGDAQPQ